MDQQAIHLLNQTLRGELLLLESYRHALGAGHEPGAAMLLQGCARLVERRVEQLGRRIRSLGGTPISRLDEPLPAASP